MNCPKCGAEIEDGKAYCSNPACGSILDALAPARSEQAALRLVKVQEALNLVEGFKPSLPLRIIIGMAVVFAVLLFIYFFVLQPSLA